VDGWVEIRIQDTGCGIPESIRERIFDPFFTTKSIGKGTGQGLAIAHDVIVKKHAGSIAVESAPGTGTTFVLRLPLTVEKADVIAAA
jgi:two-component system NtrC family sensor kinase